MRDGHCRGFALVVFVRPIRFISIRPALTFVCHIEQRAKHFSSGTNAKKGSAAFHAEGNGTDNAKFLHDVREAAPPPHGRCDEGRNGTGNFTDRFEQLAGHVLELGKSPLHVSDIFGLVKLFQFVNQITGKVENPLADGILNITNEASDVFKLGRNAGLAAVGIKDELQKLAVGLLDILKDAFTSDLAQVVQSVGHV